MFASTKIPIHLNKIFTEICHIQRIISAENMAFEMHVTVDILHKSKNIPYL